jgi:formate hydrogenlyase subunit 6/NADH:ubiquinone oxidoreductase subunit I
MLKRLTHSDLSQLLEIVSKNYALQVPQLLADGTRQLGPYTSGELLLTGEQLQRKPTSYFFPQTELMLSIDFSGDVQQPPPAGKPLALFGLDRTDLAAIAFLDRFFLTPPTDDIYLRRRQDTLLIGLTGFAGTNGNFLPPATVNCDFELIAADGGWLAAAYSVLGEKLLKNFADGDSAQLKSLSNSDKNATVQENLQRASQLLREDRVPDEFWQEIANRCILCSGCNLACPTCSCFCLQDRQTVNSTERSRVWDSCQLDAFMREASGHNPLGTEALRTRRRIHHKLVADVERWGELGCVGCGRCDRACPTGIGMFSVVEEIVAKFGD